MKMVKAMLVLAAMAMLMDLAMAVNYPVGGNGGWSQGIDYQTWASSITFVVGDSLIFRYSPNHNVNEVSKADFDSCSADNPLQPPSTGGLTTISLTTPGSRYFICATSVHCLNGMKIEIDIQAPAAPPPPPATPPPVSPPPPAAVPPVSPPPPVIPAPVSAPPPTTPPSVQTPPPATPPSVPLPAPPTSSPSRPSLPPRPSANRPVSAPAPVKSVAPSTSPTHSHLPGAPKVSPSKPPTKGSPTLSPAGALTPSSALPPPPSSSSAVKVNLVHSLVSGLGCVLLMFLNF